MQTRPSWGGLLPAAVIAIVAIPTAAVLRPGGWNTAPTSYVDTAPDNAAAALDTLRRGDDTPSMAGDAFPKAYMLFASIDESLPYVVEMTNARIYREWQTPPLTYIGPKESEAEGRVVFRFDFPSPVRSARLAGSSFCTDFTEEPGGEGRGASAIETSGDGLEWITLRNNLEPRRWGEDWGVDERLPPSVLGQRSIWIRVRFVAEGCKNVSYTTAQFGRPIAPGNGSVFGIVAELAVDGD